MTMEEYNVEFEDLDFLLEIDPLLNKIQTFCKQVNKKYVNHTIKIGTPNVFKVYIKENININNN